MTTFDQLTATKPKPETGTPLPILALMKPLPIEHYFLLAVVEDHFGDFPLRDEYMAEITAIVAARRQEASHAT